MAISWGMSLKIEKFFHKKKMLNGLIGLCPQIITITLPE
jgi:hypothetical protein